VRLYVHTWPPNMPSADEADANQFLVWLKLVPRSKTPVLFANVPRLVVLCNKQQNYGSGRTKWKLPSSEDSYWIINWPQTF
jgi:hypothetical protein